MSKVQKIAVIMGGLSAEREVSLMSGKAVLNALLQAGLNAQAFDPGEQDLWQLKTQGFTECFICLHGKFGEDGCIQGALEWMNIPYTGSGVQASAVAMSKVTSKIIWRAAGLPVAKDVVLKKGQYVEEELLDMVEHLGFPLMVKPNTEGSSIGVVKVINAEQLKPELEQAFAKDNTVLCEQFVSGKELTCAILGEGNKAQALPLIWIEPAQNQQYDYMNKYFTDSTKYHLPSGLDENLERQIKDISVCAYQELGCRGWGRVDLMLDEKTNQPYILEINTSPGMTSHSLVPKAAAEIGMDYSKLCVEILKMATTEYLVNKK